METMSRFELIIVPSSDDEGIAQEFGSFESIEANMDKIPTAEIFTFSTERERALFLQGYQAGIGYMGEGMSFTKDPK